jgi:putative copper resistance protein D
MFTDITIWQLLIMVAKLLGYVGLAAAVGGPLMIWLLQLTKSNQSALLLDIRAYGLLFSSLGLVAVLMQLLLETGAFSESGFSGMFDPFMLQIVWQSPIGETALYRIIVFLLSLFIFVVLLKQLHRGLGSVVVIVFSLLLIVLGRSFSLSGHSVSLHGGLQLLLSLHVVMVMAWMGSLYPLLKASYQLPVKALHLLMHRFGLYAQSVVALLILTGAIIVYSLLDSFNDLVNTSYGQWLGVKLLLVTFILLLAAYHKWRLVPRLLITKQARPSLTRSIILEMFIAIAILFVTTIISSVVGPLSLK